MKNTLPLLALCYTLLSLTAQADTSAPAGAVVAPPGPVQRLLELGPGPSGRPRLEGDLTLEAALELALKGELDKGIKEAGLSRVEAGSGGGLQIQADGYRLQGDPSRLFQLDPSLRHGSLGPNPAAQVNLVHARLMVPLFSGGEFENRMAAAREAEKAALARVALSLREAAREVRHAYFFVLHEEARLELAGWQVEQHREAQRTAAQLLKRGEVAPFVLSRHETQTAEAEQQLNRTAAELVAAEAKLKTRLGLDLSSRLSYPEKFVDPPDPGTLEENLATARAERPDLIAARHGVEEGRLRLEVARAAYAPRLHLSGGVNAVTDGSLSGGLNTRPAAELSLSIPLFDGGLQEAEVSGAEAAARARRRRLEQLGADVERQVVEVRARLDAARSNLEIARRQAEQAASEWDVVLRRSQVGQSTHLEVLDALESCSRARYNLNKVGFEAATAYADLLFVTGRY